MNDHRSDSVVKSAIELSPDDATADFAVDSEISALLPQLTETEMDGLLASIRCEGVRDPLVVGLIESSRILLDGHHRLAITTELGLPTPAVVTREFDSRAAAMRWVIENGVNRRNLNDDQRAGLMARLGRAIAKETRSAKAKVAGKAGGRGRGRAKTDPERGSTNGSKSSAAERPKECTRAVDTSDPRADSGPTSATVVGEAVDSPEATSTSELSAPPKRIREVLAAAANVSERKMRTATLVAEASTAALDQVIAGKKTLGKAKREVLPRRQDPKPPTGCSPTRRSRGAASVGELACPGGPYDLVLIDPRWPERESDGMGFDEIHSLKIPLDKNCVVWFCTPPWALAQAIHILEGWGLKFLNLHCWHDPSTPSIPTRLQGCVLEASSGRADESPMLASSVFISPSRRKGEVPDETYAAFRRRPGRARLVVGGHRDVDGCTRWNPGVLA